MLEQKKDAAWIAAMKEKGYDPSQGTPKDVLIMTEEANEKLWRQVEAALKELDLTEGERQTMVKQSFDNLHIRNMDATTFGIEFWKGIIEQQNHGIPASETTAFHALKSKLHPGQLESVQKTVHEFQGQYRTAKTWQEALEVLKEDAKRKREATAVRQHQAVYFGHQVAGPSKESPEKEQTLAEKRDS